MEQLDNAPLCPELAQFLAEWTPPKPKPKQPDRWADYVPWKPEYAGQEPPF